VKVVDRDRLTDRVADDPAQAVRPLEDVVVAVLDPAPSRYTVPTTWAASPPRGYTRRVSGISEMPAIFIFDTFAACDPGTRCARYTKPVWALVSSLISVSWGTPSAGESSAASDTAFLTR
jgi:hypothetical protein